MTYISERDFFQEVNKGTYTGESAVNKFGRNVDCDAAEDIWDGGGDWVGPTTARTHDIVSTSTADDGDPVGTGARTVTIQGLDSGAVFQEEIVTMNGTTNVATANTYLMIHRMFVKTSGTGLTNAGTITATAQTDATVTAQMTIGMGQTLMAIYQVPDSVTAYIMGWYASLGKSTGAAGGADVMLMVYPSGEAWQVKNFRGMLSDGSSSFYHPFKHGIKVLQRGIIKVRCTDVTAVNSDVAAGFEITLVNN